MPYASGNEQDLVDALRRDGGLALSLVATEPDGAMIGHIAFSPASAGDWYALGPVSVDPARQRRGVGRLLIEEGLRRLVARGAAGCILVGNPALYGRFGFAVRPTLAPAGVPAAFFMVLPLAGSLPAAPIAFHPLFGGAAEKPDVAAR